MDSTKDSKREILIEEINKIKEERYIRLIYYFTITIKNKILKDETKKE